MFWTPARLFLLKPVREGTLRISMAGAFSRVAPTPEQCEAIRIATAGNAVLRAGPGSGKTTVLTMIFEVLSSRGRKVSVMSHTNASADAFNDRLGKTAAMTMHSFCRQSFGVEASFDATFPQAIEVVESSPALNAEGRISLLVDEAQDCNRNQFALLETLMRKGYHVVCVGDAQQSIYEFHGAAPELFDAFGEGKSVTSFDLTENWRSTPLLVEAFNEFAACNFSSPLRQRCMRLSASGPSPRFASFGSKDEMYEEIARLHRNRPMLTALLVLKNGNLDESHVRLFEKGVPAITFSSERSDEFRRVPEDLQCAGVLQLLTIWGGKGQEFPRVVVLGGEDLGKGETTERARLLFVAMTRAVDELHVFGAAGTSSARPFSRFLEPLLPAEFRRGRMEASAEASVATALHVKKVSEAFGEDILRSVFSDRDPSLLFSDHIIEVGYAVGAPNRQLTRLGLEETYGVIMEEKAREALTRSAGPSQAALDVVDEMEKAHIPPDLPERSALVQLRESIKEHLPRHNLDLKPFAVKAVLLKRLNGLLDRAKFKSEKWEPPALRKACEELIDFLVAFRRGSKSQWQKVYHAAKKMCASQTATYRDLLSIVRDQWHLDQHAFLPSRALLIAALRSTGDAEPSTELGDTRGSSSLACLGLALRRRSYHAHTEDYAVLRALTHLRPPLSWPSGLRLSDADLEVPERDALSLRRQGDSLWQAGYTTVREKKYVSASIGEIKLGGEPDMQGDDFVAEIKHVQDITPAHVCQALLYAALTKALRVVLWDTRHGRHYTYRLQAEDHRLLLQAVQERHVGQTQTAAEALPLEASSVCIDGRLDDVGAKRRRSE